jgi:hypothetical protein
MGIFESMGENHSRMRINPVPFRYPRSRAQLHDLAVFLARSTSHSVAARHGCTNIPLAAVGAQEDETILAYGFSKPWVFTVRPPGSARTDQVLEDLRVRSAFIVRRFSSRLPR